MLFNHTVDTALRIGVRCAPLGMDGVDRQRCSKSKVRLEDGQGCDHNDNIAQCNQRRQDLMLSQVPAWGRL
ncbi:BQ5605_C003g01881 [Microbotryum silenes-dioicae]|uniref:BQ5605_C003g01881 protein n=1 Tax=Microbotryum silenes-dioicae TaxID=796604 RepID=A0A2X0P2X6_9BASI|nr:BQ5605_C003g01881 [Microbotryum silenes-dioicae]